jgi:two-component system, OmpR family, torCAD operon response regulator TorR
MYEEMLHVGYAVNHLGVRHQLSRRQHLLVVEDDPAVLSLFVAYLEKDGYQVTGATTAASAEALVKKQEFDLILLDLGLPDEDGLVVARRIRASSAVPLVFVTQRTGEADKIAGLELGADDYITKPFNPRELSARIRNILARTDRGSLRPGVKDVVHFGGWALDLGRYTLTDGGGNPIPLTRAEFDVLKSLLLASGRAVTRDALLDAIRAKNPEGSDRIIDVLVSRLRRKLEAREVAPKVIVTVLGVGYRIGVPVHRT